MLPNSPTVTKLIEIGKNEEIGYGWRRFRLRASNIFTEKIFSYLANSLGFWDRLARTAFEKGMSKNGNVVSLPISNAVDAKLPPIGSNFRPRKYYDPVTKELVLWGNVQKAVK